MIGAKSHPVFAFFVSRIAGAKLALSSISAGECALAHAYALKEKESQCIG